MTRIIQDFTHEMPQYGYKIRYLRFADKKFSKLASEYDSIDKEIHFTEEYVENTIYVENLRKKLGALREELYEIIMH